MQLIDYKIENLGVQFNELVDLPSSISSTINQF